MNKIIIGCDPDSDKSGFAFVVDGDLVRLECLSLVDVFFEFESLSKQFNDIELHIENVKGIKGVYQQRVAGKSKQSAMMVAQNLGQCKQVQTEIERIAEHFGIKVVRHPVSKMWKDSKTGKAALKEVFGYKGQSNEDSRSACYFSYRALQMNK